MNPIFYFILFFIFLVCQVAMVLVGMFVADCTGATGHYYWSIVLVMFLLLNELCFGHYDFELGFNEDEDDDEYEWLGDEDV